MTDVRFTPESGHAVHAHRARKRVGLQKVVIELSEHQIDRLADDGYLDGDNTVAEALALFVTDQMPFYSDSICAGSMMATN